MLEVDAAANSRCSSGAATASGASDANGTAAPATNVSASLGGGGGAVVVPPASHTSAAFGARAGLATDEVRASHELREAASEALLAAAKEEESPRLTGWLATPPTKTAAFLLQLENGGRMTRANAATVLATLEAVLGADGELVRAWRLQAVLGPSAVAAEGALALPRTAGLRGGMPPKGVAAKRGGDGGGGSGRGRGGGGRGRGRGTVAAGRGKAPAVDKRKADAVASNSRVVSGGGGASKRPKANPKALTCDESDSCSDGKAKAVASESDSEMADDEPVPVPAKTSSEDVAAAIVGEHGGTFKALDHDNPLHVIEQGATPPLLLLYADLMSEVFKHVDVPFALKLSCRATRVAAPGETETKLSSIVTSVKLLEWAIDQGLPLDEDVCAAAAEGGHLDCLKWARERVCPWNEWTCAMAAAGGHLDCLKWAREHGCPWHEWTCAWAAGGGHLDCLQWAREHGCPWDEDTCALAAGGGHLACLVWARARGCELNEQVERASGKWCNGHLCMQWAREHGCQWDTYTCHAAAEGGHLDCLVWAREHGCKWDKEACENVATDPVTLRWIKKQLK